MHQYLSQQIFCILVHRKLNCPFNFIGELQIPNYDDCEYAIGASGKPTIFVKLIPTDPTYSTYTENDEFAVPMMKSAIKCEKGKFLSCFFFAPVYCGRSFAFGEIMAMLQGRKFLFLSTVHKNIK